MPCLSIPALTPPLPAAYTDIKEGTIPFAISGGSRTMAVAHGA